MVTLLNAIRFCLPKPWLRVWVCQVRVASLQQKCAEAAEITQVNINGEARVVLDR